MIHSYCDLLVWQKGMTLTKLTYALTARFPDSERYGLANQMRRAAVSVPSNIAEGQARQGRREFVQFFSHAEGSLAELDAQMLLSIDLGYCTGVDGQAVTVLITELQKMLTALRRRVAARNPSH